jgi:hypothetical protein
MFADEHNRRIAERCLRMATFCERGQSALSLRQIAADHLDLASEPDHAEKLSDEAGHKDPVRPLRKDSTTNRAVQSASAQIKNAVQSAATRIKVAIQSTIIVASGILVGILGFVAVMLAMAPPGTTKASAQQIECRYRQVVSLDWSPERSLDSLQKLWAVDCPASLLRSIEE